MEKLALMAQRVLEAQPFSAPVGARVASFSEGEAVLEVPIRDELLQQNGFIHGGVLSYASDNALTFAGGSVLGPAVLTSEYKINYLRPTTGKTLVARASVVYAGKRQAVCRCDVFAVGAGGEETLCAVAQGTIAATGEQASEAKEPHATGLGAAALGSGGTPPRPLRRAARYAEQDEKN
jgi:uncharacterized protein (TIGR00369 family)